MVSLQNHKELHGAMRAWYSPYDDLKVLFSRFLSILSEEKPFPRRFDRISGAAFCALPTPPSRKTADVRIRIGN
ncbi:hypothetical protein FJTKL_04110 [Diaporthe vaccinii]|uniref:Uncharacterized protein n=1 Tax=Diaporthe vaccinii TaxID=105482 RepID=A0ABR4DU76_9PEZI